MLTLEQINQRIEKMGEWASQVEATLKSIKQATGETAINGAAMSQELAMLWKQYASPAADLRQFQRDIIAAEMELSGVVDEMELIESQAMLDVSFATDDKGKPLYSNDASRKAALKVALGSNEEYKELTERHRLIKVGIDNIKADIAHSEAVIKEFHYRSRSLTVRIEYDIAVLNSLKGDK